MSKLIVYLAHNTENNKNWLQMGIFDTPEKKGKIQNVWKLQ